MIKLNRAFKTIWSNMEMSTGSGLNIIKRLKLELQEEVVSHTGISIIKDGDTLYCQVIVNNMKFMGKITPVDVVSILASF